jgi:hypothetical protein
MKPHRIAVARFSWQSAMSRALIGVFGGLALALSFMVGTGSTLAALRWMTRADAVVTTGMLAFLVWTVAVLVSFGAESVKRAAGWVLGGSAAFALLGFGGNYLMHAT